ncbi:ABC transporter ATP-binding protein [Hyphobacterium marinum]|uniref:ABC transporter ATP-binding protein n=1 Tax=Hyphobacterium marinum TaxID=3116574 RepID=A0ABU7LWN2_9PROT|nr:ABC transporter ATP-binding protein [Hyphobacterium sp. Y6023]MEE2565973.1 ABC transporter ATP-binding protein [Hyphobacterium sp. Y6023]
MSETDTPASTLLARLWREYLAPRWRLVTVAVVLSALTAAAASSYAFMVQWAFSLIEREDARVVWLAPIVIIAISAIRGLSLYLQTLQTNRLALKVMQDLQEAMYVRLVRADFARLVREPVGNLVSRFTNDITLMREALVRAANNLLRDTLTVAGTIAAMFYFDWMLAILVLVIYPIAALPVIRIGKMLRRTSTEAQTQMGEVTSFLDESFSGARMVKTYRLEDYETERSRHAFLDRFRLALSLTASKARVDPILEIVGGAALAGVLAVGGWRISQGATSIADILGFLTAIAMMAPAVRAIGTLSAVAQEGMAVLNRAFALIDEPDTVLESPDAKPLNILKAEVVLEDVEFAYGDGATALHDINVTAKSGETIAFVGPSGSGKTTILNLIPRLYDPVAGSVRIDGQDISKATVKSVRDAVALVSQDVTLFDDSIRANIAFGRLDASDAEIIDAAKAADAHDFITALPQGYDTPVGPRGGKLSGGQRQRIAIARAILKDAPILLLDEATSALDAEAEARVQEALKRLAKGRTTLVIAHRLATVRDADRICVLEDGRIVEDGRHDDLIARDGLYARLSKLQFAT